MGRTDKPFPRAQVPAAQWPSQGRNKGEDEMNRGEGVSERKPGSVLSSPGGEREDRSSVTKVSVNVSPKTGTSNGS